ncbi:MAG: type I phosphomannose isomerase catalytic subunit [Planctomycetota bacterium]
MKPYPLTLRSILKPKVWGGRRLTSLGKQFPNGEQIGESWELADLGATSADGGGGGEARSVIANGPMRGITLANAINAMGSNLMGSLRLSADGGFPLLVKFIDARENLSVQVHPSAEFAAANPGAHLKTESWYVVDAQPGSKIYKGVRAGTTREEFAEAIRENRVEELMLSVEARSGDFHHLPSGTCHALGAGVLLAEVQTPSDTTFRVYDWGRTDRTLHVDEALACIEFGPPERLEAIRNDRIPDGADRFKLVETEHYVLWEGKALGRSERVIDTHEDKPVVWMCLDGGGRLESTDGSFEPVPFEAGATTLIPARLDDVTAVFERDSTVLTTRFPEAMNA